MNNHPFDNDDGELMMPIGKNTADRENDVADAEAAFDRSDWTPMVWIAGWLALCFAVAYVASLLLS